MSKFYYHVFDLSLTHTRSFSRFFLFIYGYLWIIRHHSKNIYRM